ncbi:hypothetical protein D9M72_472380 [compost metagenome]
MPENTLRVRPSPRSSVSCSSLFEPSTFWHSTIFATRRSTLAKSSMVMVSAIGSIAEPAAAGAAVACSDSRLAASSASTCLASTRVIRC